MWPIHRQTKEFLAFILGGIGFAHELFLYQGERPFLLTASLALMGFPLVFRAEEKIKKNGNDDSGKNTENDSTD